MIATLSLKRRPLALLLAFLLAGLATVALASYIDGVKNRVTPGVATKVYVAKDTIPAFTSISTALSRGLIEQVTVPQNVAAFGAIGSLEAIRDAVSSIDIAKGEQLIAARFVSAEQAAGILPIPAGKHALSVSIDLSPAVGGFIRPNDHVSVLAKVDVPSSKGGATATRVGFLLQNVPVLAVGDEVASPRPAATKASDTQAQVRNQVLLTLAVTPAEAERVAFAALEGELYFTLLSRTAPAVGKTAGQTAATLFPKR